VISGNSNPAAYGGWEYQLSGIEAGKWYRFVAYYRAEGLLYEPLQVVARLDWASLTGEPRGPGHDGRSVGRAGQPNYAYKVNREGEWKSHDLRNAGAGKRQVGDHSAIPRQRSGSNSLVDEHFAGRDPRTRSATGSGGCNQVQTRKD